MLDKGNLDSETRLKRTRSQTKLKDPSKAKKSKADADQEQTFSIDTQSIWKCQNCTLENQVF